MKMISNLTAALVFLTASAAYAQESARPANSDGRWAPWLGCWRLVQEGLRDAGSTLARSPQGSSTAASPDSEELLVCMLPSKIVPGVEMTTFVGGRSVLQQTILANGVGRPVSEPECSGQQTNEWSQDGLRLFTRAEIACSGQPRRTVSGVTMMVDGPTWIDIQAVQIDQDQHVRTRLYRRTANVPAGVTVPTDLDPFGDLRVDGEPRRTIDARALGDQFAGGMRMTIADVIEASSKIASSALEAALVETGSRFDLNSRALRELANAGVEADVIDLMVALSFPDRFSVDRRTPQPSGYGATVTSGQQGSVWTVPGWYGGSYPYDPYAPYSSYSPYGSYYPYYSYSYYPYYYSPFGYSNWWGNTSHYYYLRPPSSVGSQPGPPAEPRSGQGRVVQGRGYTRVRPNNGANPPPTEQSTSGGEDNSRRGSGTAPSNPSSRRAVSREGYSSGDSGSGSSSGGSSSGGRSSSGGGSSSSGGSSSGGGSSSSGGSGSSSGSGSGRTAQPR